MTTNAPPYQLAAVMTPEDCEKLHDYLNTAYESAIMVKCDAVTRLPGLAAQLLVMAQKSWQQRGFGFALSDISPACADSLKTLGLQQFLAQEGAAE
ncbi:STAS domain-containing protein [Yoonia sp. I 8.24]|uniref:STAS domain-containing protein n=1 Tax=Yoonia sp. I 8.24 TaxID=1537229 RepID=UPI001EDD0B08|nr:STAS domain-containing protein [Yoonia sp. I 8.24]MCG3267093.1 anti-sigma factor antagonist [Yoonia sp. I 8.24]